MSDDTTNEEDFAALFEASLKTKRLATGQTVEGTIVAIGPEVALVDVGDRIQATIVSMAGGITLSRRLQRGAASRRQVEDAFRSGLPVEGKVEGQVKGGYSVSVARLRAFCPVSQIDIVRDTDPESHIG